MLDIYLLQKVPGLKGGPFLILITLTLICTTSCTGNVMYLRGVPRLNDSSYWDYYFLCNTVGASLLWEVNGTRFNRFESGEVGEALSGTLPSFTYTATLLSSKQLTDGQFTFDSLLIVSVPGSSSLDVVCSNGPSSNRTSNMENGKGVENSNSTNSIFLEYLLTENIVGDKISQTSIFICGVQNPFMYWHTGTSTDVIGFFEFDNVGEERRNLVQGANTVDRLAVVIADEPYQIVSVLFVIHTANVTVTCGDNQNETYLATIYESPSIPTVQTDPEIVSSSTLGSSTTGGGTVDTTQDSSNIIIGVVIGFIVPIMVIVTITVSVIIWKRRQQQQTDPVISIDFLKSIKISGPQRMTYCWSCSDDAVELMIKIKNDDDSSSDDNALIS